MELRRSVMLLVVVALSTLAGAAAPMVSPGDHQMTFTSTWDGTEQPYRLFVPRGVGERPLPLAVVLHGHGVDHNAWFDFTPIKSAAEGQGYAVAAPLGRGNGWYRAAAERDVLDIMDHVATQFAVDADRVYLMGHSMGGWGTAWIGLRNAERFAAIAPMSGWAPLDLLPNARHLAPFLVHDADDPIVPAGNSRTAVARLGELGISHRYREEIGYGHASALIGDNFARLFDWFGQHRRVTNPRRVTLAARTPAAGSLHWVRLLDTAVFPETATIDARVRDDGSVEVATRNVTAFALRLSGLPIRAADTRRVVVDGAEFEIVGSQEWYRFHSTDAWSGTALAGEPPVYSSPEITLPWEMPDPSDVDAWQRAWTEILVGAAGAEVGLFAYLPFRYHDVPWTRDALLDIYVYAEEYLGRAHLTGHEITAQLLRSDIQYSIGGVATDDLELDRVYDVISPVLVLRRMGVEPTEILPERVDTMLVRAVLAAE